MGSPVNLSARLAEIEKRMAERSALCAPRPCEECSEIYEPRHPDDKRCSQCVEREQERLREERLRLAEAERRDDWQGTLRRGATPPAYIVPPTLGLPADLLAWEGDPWCVTFLGLVGSGKTWAATRLFGEMLCKGFGGLWVDTTEGVERIRRAIATDMDGVFLDHLMQSKLVLFDDMLAEREDSEFARDKLSLILRHRYNHRLPTIITSNSVELDGPKKGQPGLGGINKREPRIASRLAEGIVKKLSGTDRRVKA